jgi:hypothetical protein
VPRWHAQETRREEKESRVTMLLDLTPYKNPDALRDLVASFPDAKKYYGQRNSIQSPKSIGSSGSMFRVFGGIDKPSLIYKNWAFTQTQSGKFESDVLSLNTQEQFEKFHSALGDSLSDYWKDNAKGDGKEKELTPSHKLKLLDVFIKRACELKLPNAAMNDNLLAFGHIPLDSLVFNALDSIFSGVLLLTGRSMGDVKGRPRLPVLSRSHQASYARTPTACGISRAVL